MDRRVGRHRAGRELAAPPARALVAQAVDLFHWRGPSGDCQPTWPCTPASSPRSSKVGRPPGRPPPNATLPGAGAPNLVVRVKVADPSGSTPTGSTKSCRRPSRRTSPTRWRSSVSPRSLALDGQTPNPPFRLLAEVCSISCCTANNRCCGAQPADPFAGITVGLASKIGHERSTDAG